MRAVGPLARYTALLESGEFLPDAEQQKAVQALERLHADLLASSRQSGWRRLLRRATATPRGLYLWGSVGRGKTALMDLFFESLPGPLKCRSHFHRFMLRVHAELAARSHASDPLREIARDWSREFRVLCFDEFHVSDIADAMLLGGLLENFVSEGVVLVATSNSPPSDLYRDGLQRARFLPAIALLEQHCEVLEVGGAEDYRLRLLERSELYRQPAGPEADIWLESRFRELAGHASLPPVIAIGSRSLQARKAGDGVVWFDFSELCMEPRGSGDYIELARSFNTVLISGVPVLTEELADATRRFINLVDEFYDRNVKLLLSAAAPLEQLYRGQRLAFEFERTRSRLTEMQAHDYLALPHLP